jgi:hypothetical protein
VASFINAPDKREVVFTKGCTEGINLVAQTWGRSTLTPGDEVLVTWMEHHSNIVPWQLVCAATGATLKVCPITDRGELDLDAFEGREVASAAGLKASTSKTILSVLFEKSNGNNSYMIRQPFDFAGRTGKIDFDVGGEHDIEAVQLGIQLGQPTRDEDVRVDVQDLLYASHLKQVLEQKLDFIGNVQRVTRPAKLPVVLTPSEEARGARPRSKVSMTSIGAPQCRHTKVGLTVLVAMGSAAATGTGSCSSSRTVGMSCLRLALASRP